MTLRNNKTKAEKFQAMEKAIEQLQLATRMSQMIVQQITKSFDSLSSDVNELATRQRDAQYRLLAAQDLMKLDTAALAVRTQELQIKDFEELSAKEDTEMGCTPADVVEGDSVVVFTSKTPDGGGILRSRLSVGEIGFPELRESLLGKKVGDKVTTDVNGVSHDITLLGIRKLPAKVENVEPAQVN